MTDVLSPNDLADTSAAPADDEVFVFPVSFAQQRLWFLDQFEPNSPYYNIPVAVRLEGPLDVSALERALNEIVRRHEVLRTTFATHEGEPVQLIAPRLGLRVPVLDLTHLPDGERMAEARRLADEDAQKPFNLATGPLLRATLLRLGDRDHVACFTMHHIVSDGWSMGVLIRELGTLYEAFSGGRPSPLPELPIQYADFAQWQRERLQGEVLERQLAYWKERLGGELPVLRLPTDRPRPSVQTSRGDSITALLPARLADELQRLGQREGATLFMTLLAGFQALLGRYSGQHDVCVGSPIANRNRAELEPLIGFFVNTLVLRTDLAGDPTFRELLGRVRETALGAFQHQDVPFEQLVEALQPKRDLAYSPLFQAMFILQNAGGSARDAGAPEGALRLSQLDSHSGTSTFDLTLSVAPEPEGLSASLEFNVDLFDRSTMARFLEHFRTLLESAVAAPDTPLSRLGVLPAAERERMLVAWNRTGGGYDFERCVHEVIAEAAARDPAGEAVVANGERLTYGELDRRATQLAHHLRRHGVGPETLVGVYLDKCCDLIVALVGVLKAGGAYVPMDPTYPADRIAFMVEDARPPVLLTHAALEGGLPPHEAHVVRLDADRALLDAEPVEPVDAGVRPDNLAYVIYTSGSTGKPKGVMIEHRSLVNQYLAWEEPYELRTRARRHLQMASFSFDVFTGDFARGLCSGGTLVLVPREILMQPERLFELASAERVDIGEFVPAVLRDLVGHLDQTGRTLGFMRTVLCGSDSWNVAEYLRFRQYLGPETRLINSFGLTEATIDSTWFEAETLDPAQGDRMVPIGRPFANTTLYIVDAAMQPAPIGVPGELCIGGPGLARGYRHRPDLTAEKFVPHPFDRTPGARIYRTGDAARYRPDGNVEFLGRIDNQVKIRGYRIEPGEIEAILGAHEAVQSVAVLARPSGAGDLRLVAYVVPQGEPPAPAALRSFVAERLPDYMVPSAFVLLEAMPLTPNGKVDRKALPEPEWDRSALGETFVAPRTPTEELLAGLFARVLGIGEVGADDDFFQLGGHSLLATQLLSRIRDAFRVEIPLRNIFEYPTVASLAERIDHAAGAGTGRAAPPIRPVPRDRPLPLSFAQQRLWFLDQLEPGSPSYNLPEAVRVAGPLDVAVLHRGLNEIVRRHEALRTRFEAVDGRPVQVIEPQMLLPLPVTDLSHLGEDTREAEAARIVREEMARPFDLARGPLLRGRVVRLAPEDHLILLTVHHIASDDWSGNVFMGELSALYEAYAAGRPSPLPPLPVQYADFAAWQREWLQGEVLEAQIDYWKRQLAGAPPLLELPTDRPRPPVQTFAGDYVSFELPGELTGRLRELSRAEGATLFMTLLGAWQVLLARYAGTDDVVVGTPIANRNRGDVEGLIGFFVNTLVLRTDLSGRPSFRELLARVRETALEAYQYQDVPFETIVDALQPERDLSHSPLFQVMFALQNAPRGATELADARITLRPVDAHSATAKFDLTLFVVEEGDRLSGALEFNTDLFDRSTIERLAGHYRMLLEGLSADPDQAITRIPMLTDAERDRILFEWNDTAAPYPADRCVHHLVADVAARQPEAVAVAGEDGELTFADLESRANRIAQHLRRLGVGPETLVGVALPRSPALVAALLGVLKAGGAYVPLDPAYPAERLAFMMNDARLVALLTTDALAGVLPVPAGCRVVRLDADAEVIAAEPDQPPASGVGPDNLAYVIYTSGSTGQPKGAMILHRGLSNYLAWCRRAYPLAGGAGAPLHSSISFDLTVTSIFAPLTAGRAVRVVPDAGGVEALGELLRATGDFSLVKITPAHLELLGQQLDPAEAAGRTRAFIIGGENLTAEHVAFWREHAPGSILFNEYGPTETVVGCCVYEVPLGAPLTGSVPIGRPIINTRLYALDDEMQPVPIGVPGELYIGGAGVARGYLNRPELSAERFVADPFLGGEERMYRTGDRVRYRPDGNLEFLGRLDDQVKVRGFRIELGEIEAALAAHPSVAEAAVVAREDEAGARRLVAYLVPDGEPVPAASLREHLGRTLPDYMVPAVFVSLDALPLTANGKVDRRRLPAPEVERAETAAYAPPSSHAEQVLAEIWGNLLGVAEVGVHDNFFDLGGDSILSIQVIARARQRGLHLTPRQLFQEPTIAGLARLASAARGDVSAEQGVLDGYAPLTPIQHWFFEHHPEAPDHWNQSMLLEPPEALDREILAAAVDAVLAQHDALRLGFELLDDRWTGRYTPPAGESPLWWIRLAAVPDQQLEEVLARHAAEAQASLSLAAGPLFRAVYFDLGQDRGSRLLLVAHHLAVDAVSWRILLEDLQAAYLQRREGRPIALPPKTSSVRQWAARLRRYANDPALQAEAGYWRGVVAAGAPPVPRDADGENLERTTAAVALQLGPDETRALLQEVPAAHRADLQEVLLTALAVALDEWTGGGVPLIDVEGHGREDLFDEIDLSRTVGWFTALYPVRLEIDRSADPGERLRRVRAGLRALPNRGLGFGVLRYLARDPELLAAAPGEVAFNYLGQTGRSEPDRGFAAAAGGAGPERAAEARRTHLLEITGAVSGDRLELEWAFSTAVHRRETIERVAARFLEALRELIAHCRSADAPAALTAGDVAEFGWGQEDLDDIMSAIRKTAE